MAIVCVAGPYRTGKSFLLNTLVGRQEERAGFQVGGSIRACTKGIWLWGEPVKKGDSTYLFMDSEGLGSTDQHITFDTQILSLAMLLSSFFILNTQGTITEQTLTELELVVKCSEHIRITEEKSDDDKGDIFPDFLWVLRDFALQLQDENENPITAKEYLEQSLRNRAGAPPEKNRVRDAIKNVFRNRDCRTLVRPITEEDKLQKLPTMPWASLRPEFRTQVESLCGLVYSSAKPKQIEGGFVNGPAVVGLAEAYVQALNTGKMPVIHTAWQSVVMQQSAHALETALQLYEECFSRLFAKGPVDQDRMLEEFRLADEAAVAKLKAMSVGDETQLHEQVQQLIVKATALKKAKADMNELQSRDLCQKLIEQLWARSKLEGKVFPNAAEFEASMQSLRDAYEEHAQGPCKDEVGRDFFEKRQQVVARSLFAQLEQAQHAQAVMLEEKNKLEDKLAKALQRIEELQRQHQQAVEAKDAKLEGLQTKLHSLQESSHKAELDYQGKMHALEKAKSELASQLESAHQARVASDKNFENQLRTLTSSLEAERQSRSTLEKESDKNLKDLNAKLVASEKEREVQAREFTAKLAASEKERETQVRELTTKLAASEKAHEAQTKEFTAKLTGSENAHEAQAKELTAKLVAAERAHETQTRELTVKLAASEKAYEAQTKELAARLAASEKERETQAKEFAAKIDSSEKSRGAFAKDSEQRIQELQAQAKDSEQRLRELQAKLDQAAKRSRDSEEQYQKDSQTRDKEAHLKYAALEKRCEKAEGSEAAAQQTIRELTSELTSARGTLGNRSDELHILNTQKAATEEALHSAKAQNEKLQTDLRKAHTTLAEAEKQTAQKTDLSTKLQRRVAQLEQEQLAKGVDEEKRISELETKVEELQKIGSEQEQSVVQKLIQISNLEKELAEAKSDFEHMSQIKSEMEGLLKEVRLLKQENETLKKQQSEAPPKLPNPVKRKPNEDSSPEPTVRFRIDQQENIPPAEGEESAEEEEEKGSEAYWKRSAATVEERRKRQSLAPAPQERLKNPERCTVQELMSWLTSIDVDLPPTKQKKQFYLDLLYKAEPELRKSK